MMMPLPYIWPVCIPFWLAYGWAYVAELRRVPGMRGSVVPEMDKGSLKVILWTIALANIGAFAFAGFLPSMAMTAVLPAYVAGILLIISGGLLRRHCFAMLGRRFTYAVNAMSDQMVVETGAYRFIRHPSYLAGLIKFAGIGLGLGNWASFALCMVLPALAYGYRISVEERALIQMIGPAYEDYMKRTSRLIPFVL
jgi:protein-S-isoprenylcysteine O-methyltransferase Ste14